MSKGTEICGVVAALRALDTELLTDAGKPLERRALLMSLTSEAKGSFWRIESNDDAWVVAASLAMPAWQYRQLLSVVVRQTPRFVNLTCRWAPEIDPYAILLYTEWTEVILCWNKELCAVAVLVPAEISDEESQLATQTACNFLAFVCSLIGNSLQPISAFVMDDDENESWVASAVVGDLRLC